MSGREGFKSLELVFQATELVVETDSNAYNQNTTLSPR
jgi:hypothetical protein